MKRRDRIWLSFRFYGAFVYETLTHAASILGAGLFVLSCLFFLGGGGLKLGGGVSRPGCKPRKSHFLVLAGGLDACRYHFGVVIGEYHTTTLSLVHGPSHFIFL